MRYAVYHDVIVNAMAAPHSHETHIFLDASQKFLYDSHAVTPLRVVPQWAGGINFLALARPENYVKQFEHLTGARKPILGAKSWLILVTLASSGRVVTYKQFAAILGMGQTAFTVGTNALGPVAWYCLDNELPPLTSIVINAERGSAGDGIPDYPDIARVLEWGLSGKWLEILPPRPNALLRVIQQYGEELL